MGNTKETKKKLISTVEVIKKINDDPKKFASESISDAYTDNLEELVGKKRDQLNKKINQKKDKAKDIFSDLVEIAEKFISDAKKTKSNVQDGINQRKNSVSVNFDKNPTKSKIKRYAIKSAETTLGQAKEIAIKHFSQALFMGEGICGTDSIFAVDQLTISPEEFDFLNTLTIDPDSNCGKLIYEPKTPNRNKEKVNRNLYNTFTGGTYTFTSNNSKNLFSMSWSASTQTYLLTGLTQGGSSVKVQNFISDYYNSVEFPDIDDVLKTTMSMVIQGGSSCSQIVQFNTSFEEINRLIKKLLALCGSPTKKDNLVNQTAVKLFDENNEDVEFFFDFDATEGIDLDDEDLRYRRVLRFKDCYNFEIDVDDMHIEDFIYLSKNKGTRQAVDDVLQKVAQDANEQSDFSLNINDFLNNLLNNFILSLPRALIMTILSAKIFLPIAVLYKIFKNALGKINVKELAKKFYIAIKNIVKDLFWLFIREFWKLVKVDLLAFVNAIVKKILKNKYKRYLTIITALISILKKILETNIDNCFELFQTVLNTIKSALSMKTPMSVPSILLALSEGLPGYSQDRAYMNIMERLEASGVPTGPLFGESNDIGNIVKSIVDGHTEEEDQNSFVKIVLQGGVLPGPTGGAVIPPAIISGVGKKF
jgi:hypothetical protein